MAKLGAAADAQDPVFTNLNAAAANLNTFFHQLVPFSHESVPSLRSLGNASAVGKPAVQAAGPAVAHLNQFAKPTPELAQNLAITLQALDTRNPIPNYAGGPVEPDPRSPQGGKGYTGLEGLLEYVFNITNAISYYGSYGHMLAADIFANSACSPYATPQTIANNLASYQSGQGVTNPRSCYAQLGPNAPGVNEPDPSNPQACVPDPGGYPVEPGNYGVTYSGPKTSVCKLPATNSPTATPQSTRKTKKRGRGTVSSAATRGSPAAGGGSSGASGSPLNLNQTVGQIISQLTGSVPPVSTPNVGGTVSTPSGGGTGSQAQQLLNYLLAP